MPRDSKVPIPHHGVGTSIILNLDGLGCGTRNDCQLGATIIHRGDPQGPPCDHFTRSPAKAFRISGFQVCIAGQAIGAVGLNFTSNCADTVFAKAASAFAILGTRKRCTSTCKALAIGPTGRRGLFLAWLDLAKLSQPGDANGPAVDNRVERVDCLTPSLGNSARDGPAL
jgi:hypothetical protein